MLHLLALTLWYVTLRNKEGLVNDEAMPSPTCAQLSVLPKGRLKTKLQILQSARNIHIPVVGGRYFLGAHMSYSHSVAVNVDLAKVHVPFFMRATICPT